MTAPTPRPLLALPAPSPMLLLAAGPIPRLLAARASRSVRVFSFGGGVQSHAVLVLQAQGKLEKPYDYFVFANVGEDSENPETLAYIENFTKPFCEKHGIKFIQVQKQVGRKKRDQRPDTLLEYVLRNKRSVPLPIHMAGGAPGRRKCTGTFKIEIVNKECKRLDFTHVFMGLGISTDEIGRARDTNWHTEKPKIEKKRDYPLIAARMNRKMCLTLIESMGLPEPPKSSCWFCPFRGPGYWIWLRRERPVLFWRAVLLEAIENKRRDLMGKDHIYFHPDCVPLLQATAEQLTLFTAEMLDACESGYCMT